MPLVLVLTLFALVASALGVESPLLFEPAPSKGFLARTPGRSLLLDATGAQLSPTARMRLLNAQSSHPDPLEPTGGASTYMTGKDQRSWRTGVPHYRKLRYRSVYPGIDVVYYGTGRTLEYDFVVAPGADPSVIQLTFDGVRHLRTERETGDLLLETPGETIRQRKPVVYQLDGSDRRQVGASYRTSRDGRVEFALGRYDRSRPLIIDPVIEYSAYIGRSGQDTATGVALDRSGNIYMTGETLSTGLATSGVFQGLPSTSHDVFVAKLTPTGSVQYFTYIGGAQTDTARGIAVDDAGNAYITGVTLSTDFPVTESGANRTHGGGGYDCFVVKLSPTGTRLEYGTYFGGTAEDWATDITVDSERGAWITGWTTSTNLSVRRAVQGGYAGGGGDAFLARVAPAGNSFDFLSYLGGEGREYGSSVAVDASGAVHVTGETTSTVMPGSTQSQSRAAGAADAFILKIIPSTGAVVYSRLLGGSSDDAGIRVAADAAGNSYVAGYTKSNNFPTTAAAASTSSRGGADWFATKLNGTTGATEFSTYLGATGDDWVGGLALDAAGSMYIAGWTNSPNLQTVNAAQSTYAGGTNPTQRYDAMVARLAPGGSAVLYSTYFGGRGEDKAYAIALEPTGAAVIAGNTTSPDLPAARGQLAPGELETVAADIFVARLSADTTSNLIAARPGSLSFRGRSGQTAEFPEQTITLTTTTGAALPFTVERSAPWIRVTPDTGTAPRTITIAANPADLQPGEYSGSVTIRAGGLSVAIPVTMALSLGPSVTSTDPVRLTRGSPDTTITLTGGGFTESSTVEINGARAASSFVDSRTLRVVVPSAFLAQAGTLTFVVVNPDARSSAYAVTVAGGAPVISAATIVNAATRLSGSVAPGLMIVISGAGFGSDTRANGTPEAGRSPTVVSETRVLFDNNPAPILWTGPGQVAAIVPYAVAGLANTNVVVEFRGSASTAVALNVAPSSPGLFTVDESGRGQAAALNQDGSLNSAANPAERGSIVVLYGTGEGVVTPAGLDGAVASAENPPQAAVVPTVIIGGAPAEVLYAGSVPGQPTGLLQMNVRVPASIPPSQAAPVVVFSGSQSSPASGVTIAVR